MRGLNPPTAWPVSGARWRHGRAWPVGAPGCGARRRAVETGAHDAADPPWASPHADERRREQAMARRRRRGSAVARAREGERWTAWNGPTVSMQLHGRRPGAPSRRRASTARIGVGAWSSANGGGGARVHEGAALRTLWVGGKEGTMSGLSTSPKICRC